MSRDFKGIWIPKEIYLDKKLNALEKIILVEIDSLDNGEDGCYASNEYLAEFCQCSQAKVSTAISKLVKCGYLEVVSFDGRKRNIKSRITNNKSLPFKNSKADVEKLKHNNKDNNKTNNKHINKIPPSVDDVKEYCEQRKNGIDAEAFVDYYAQQGWKLANGNPMKDWQAAVRTWEKRNQKKTEPKGRSNQCVPEPPKYKEFEPEPEIETSQMPESMREKYRGFINEL